jgi:hypothetical protein
VPPRLGTGWSGLSDGVRHRHEGGQARAARVVDPVVTNGVDLVVAMCGVRCHPHGAWAQRNSTIASRESKAT